MSPREELLYEFDNYKRLRSEGVYDEADSVAKRIVTLAMQVEAARLLIYRAAATSAVRTDQLLAVGS